MKKALLITAAVLEMTAIVISVLSFIYIDNLLLLRLPLIFGPAGLIIIVLYYLFIIKKPKTGGGKS